MNKIKILTFTLLLIILISTNCFANSKELKTYINTETISVENATKYEKLIKDAIVVDNINYKIENIEKVENKKTLSINKEINEELIVTTNNKYNVLNLFENKKEINEDGYKGTLELQNDSLEIKVNNSYQEEYKVYLQRTYNNVSSNDINNIPKEIKENGTTYYLVNPVWNISTTEKVDNNDIPVTYNGTMYYEGIKVRTIIRNYKASIKYTGTLEKEIIDSVTFNVEYKEIQKEVNYTIPTIASTSGIIIFSGIILIKRKNAKVYNYNKGKYNLVKKLHINKKEPIIDIAPLKITSNKFKIVLSDNIYKELKDRNIKIKYFDKQFVYLIKDKTFEINV